MAARRTSVIWSLPTEDFRVLVARCGTMSEVLSHFGLSVRGHNYRTFMKRIAEDGIDIAHIKANRHPIRRDLRPLSEVLVAGRRCHGYQLKKRLLREGLLTDRCAECGLGPEWNGLPLSLQMDHINGDHLDNRLENLRLLCPNCHAQTDTFAGKGRPSKAKDPRTNCVQCGGVKPCESRTGLCGACSRASRRKAERPDPAILREQVSELGYTGTGRFYGVSDNAIRKWLKPT